MRIKQGKYSKQLSELLSVSDNIVLICHHNPDGDAIGSMLGFRRFLELNGQHAGMISPNSIQEFLLWLKGTDSVIISEWETGRAVKLIREADLIIMFDFNHLDRSGNLKDHINASEARRILIDHHPGPEIDVDLLISEPGMSSTAELVSSLIRDINGYYLTDMEFMEAIYTGMMTDTGNFSFGTFNGDTLREVAVMLDHGLDKDKIVSGVYDNFSIDRLRLKGFATSERLVYIEEYNTAYIYLNRADLDRFRHKVGDTEGFVNLPLSVGGVIMSALFIEKEDHIKISLRSKEEMDVNRLAAKYFNGGGHKNAAGGRYAGSMEECLEYFEQVLERENNLRNK